MLRLKKMQAEKAKRGAGAKQGVSPAFLRAKKDLQEYEDIPGVQIDYKQANPMHIDLTVTPPEGYYKGGKFHFDCQIPDDFPNKAPEFHCKEKIFHPNIDLEGHVCLNILRNDWKPMLTLQLVFAGILHLFLHPNANDPLNKDAANLLSKEPEYFERSVKRSMNGGWVGEETFDNVTGRRNDYY